MADAYALWHQSGECRLKTEGRFADRLFLDGRVGMWTTTSRRRGVLNTVFLYAGLSALCFSVFNAIVKALPARIHLIYVLPFVVAGGLAIALLGLLLPKFVPYEDVILTRTGAFYALGMGAVWAIGQLVFLHMFFKYPELSVVTPIMVGGVALGGTLAGFFIFKEPISVFKVIGVAGIIVSVYILSKG